MFGYKDGYIYIAQAREKKSRDLSASKVRIIDFSLERMRLKKCKRTTLCKLYNENAIGGID